MAGESFPKSVRMISKKDFDSMRRGSFRIRADGLLLVYKKRKLDNILSRYGIIVSRKNGIAIRRNKIKRILREFCRKSSIRERGLDCLFIANIGKDLSLNDFYSHLKDCFEKIESELILKEGELC